MSDLREEQLILLRFEKKLAALAASWAAGAAAAQAVDMKLSSPEAGKAFVDIRNAIIHLAEVTGAAHAALNAAAQETGVRIMTASGGTPKEEPPKVVASLFGVG